MKDETMAGYYQLLIAIFCNLNAREARYLYDYGPAHPVCRRMMYRKLKHHHMILISSRKLRSP